MAYVTVNLAQGGDDWLAWRRDGITASDASILLGHSPYKTRWRLWAEKVGYCEEVDLSGNPLVRYGRQHEDSARAAYERQVDDIVLPMCVQSSRIAVLRASLDGLNSAGEPVELKCPSDTTWAQVCQQGTQSAAYRLYDCQVQHQLLCTGAPRGWLVFWHGEDPLQVFEVLPDRARLQRLLAEAVMFWEEVRTRREPAKDPTRDIYLPQGEQATQWIYAAEHYRLLESRMAELKTDLARLKAQQAAHLTQLTTLMGAHLKADFAGLQVTRFMAEGRVDYRKALEALRPAQDVDLAAFRSLSAPRVRVTVKAQLAPRHVLDEEVLKPLAHTSLEVESC